jgi:hypothetical protein
VSHPAQLGGIETSVLDDGPARGVRVAWFNTGSPLRFKVAIDRALDIVDAFYSEHSLAWISHGGLTAPRPDANRGFEWLYAFPGGLLTTCGLTHIGGPESDASEERGLHGRISNQPAAITSVVQPDPAAGQLDMSLTGVVKESRVFGPSLELTRTISARLGEPVIRLRDVVANRGNRPIPHMILYHCNFGWPLVDEGADVVYNGACRSFGRPQDDELFASRHNFRKCSGVLKRHSGTGESCGLIDPAPDRRGLCTVGLRNRRLGLALALKFPKRQLPWVTNWQHWGPGEYVCALEPGTNGPIGQIKARKAGELLTLGPGQSRTYEMEIRLAAGRSEILDLLGA